MLKPDTVQFKLNKEKVIKFKLFSNFVSIGKKGKKKNACVIPLVQFWVVSISEISDKKQEDKKYIVELISPESIWKVYFKSSNERSSFIETVNSTIKTHLGSNNISML